MARRTAILMNGRNPAAMTARERFDEYRPRLRAIANVLTLGQPVEINDVEMGQLTGLNWPVVRHMRHLMKYIGALEWDGQRGARTANWKLLKDGAELDRAIDLEMERQMRGGLSVETEWKKEVAARKRPVTSRTPARVSERVAVIRDRLGLDTGAVVGPEAPNPMRQVATVGKEPQALIMAAKQYRARKSGGDAAVAKARALLKELEELGVPVPRELRERAEVAVEPRLEVILLVLPYVESLERQVVALNDQLRDQPKIGELQHQVLKQRQQIERLVAERTAEALGQRPSR